VLPGPAAGRHASMGNCQAAETATVLIQHPGGGRTERAYWALSAGAVMAANPGHYVAAVITVPQPGGAGDGAASAAAPVKHLKLLRPDDTLQLGRVYRLVSFEGTSARAARVLHGTGSERAYVLGRVRPPVTSRVRIWFRPECHCFTVVLEQLFAPSFSHVAFCCRSN
jgi:hypothetical protein